MEKDIRSGIGSIEVGDRAELKKRKMVGGKKRENTQIKKYEIRINSDPQRLKRIVDPENRKRKFNLLVNPCNNEIAR